MHDTVVSKLISASRGSPCDSMASCYITVVAFGRIKITIKTEKTTEYYGLGKLIGEGAQLQCGRAMAPKMLVGRGQQCICHWPHQLLA